MKKLEKIYRDAAKRLWADQFCRPDEAPWLNNEDNRYSCWALGYVERNSSIRVGPARILYRDNILNGGEYGEDNEFENKDERTIALLFAAEMVRTGDIK